MPYDDPDRSDPMMLHGVIVETDNPDALRDMAACFIEEFLRMGMNPGRILELFHNRGCAGPYMALRTLGESQIVAMIDEKVKLRGPRGLRPSIERRATGEIVLPVLNR